MDPLRITTTEMHTGGEPVRIVTSGYPEIRGSTILEKRAYVREYLDHLRRFLMFEPRGHADMYGVLPVEPDHPEADLAVLFMHNEGYSTMCGHATIALGRWAVDEGLVEVRKPATTIKLQVPAGLVTIRAEVDDGTIGDVYFESVPAFAFALDQPVEVPGHGQVAVDIGYGGAFYAFVAATRFGLNVLKSQMHDLVEAAWAVTKAVQASVPLHHPDTPDLEFLYGTILTDGSDDYSEEPTANVCVFAHRQVDRSPTGSGVTARIALQRAREQIELGQTRSFQSVTGATFTGTGVREGRVGDIPAVVVEVGGRSYYTGEAVLVLEQDDPLPGFLVT
ncbi:MAG: proline racemase family protein [Acidimicrobiia bacterium]